MQILEEITALIRSARDIIALDLLTDYLPVEEDIDEAYGEVEDAIDEAVNDWQETGDTTLLQQRIAAAIAIILPLVVARARTLQRSGTTRGTNFARDVLRDVGTPPIFSLSRVAAAIDYVDSQAFADIINAIAPHYSSRVGEIITAGLADGLNPREVARQILSMFRSEGLGTAALRSDIERLTRTLQIYASRRATGEVYRATGIAQWLWSAALDDRTCYMCVAQHGTVHDLATEPYLNDHHRGRCAMIPLNDRVRTMAFSGLNPRFQTGVQWLAGQPASVQRQILGPTLHEAYVNGGFVYGPDTVTATYSNPLFGEMRRERNVKDILGD